MSAIELLDQLGKRPDFDINTLTEAQRAEIANAVKLAGENKPILTIVEPQEPDNDDEPKESVTN
ncbi:hypothetical protein [Alteromonas gilva]|uniref:Uncharacterized protein n=1 Tax=Alteromonas gilva TaxID=2987522 RepID=A0ABT5L4V0_9ALTE|nr:hypothetical protein [Alteromonas gilva]MDC8830887.1 hypothetical protein [Alteromonas gilva]